MFASFGPTLILPEAHKRGRSLDAQFDPGCRQSRRSPVTGATSGEITARRYGGAGAHGGSEPARIIAKHGLVALARSVIDDGLPVDNAAGPTA
jgi:hypothetical protein